MVDALLAAGQPQRIILFGSRARGDARLDSDLDLLIVQAPQPGASRWQELRHMRLALRSFPVAKDLLLFRPAEYEFWRDSLNHVVGRAVREGRLLYERP
jgi:predicted nucleotidyltransferase